MIVDLDNLIVNHYSSYYVQLQKKKVDLVTPIEKCF